MAVRSKLVLQMTRRRACITGRPRILTKIEDLDWRTTCPVMSGALPE
jgi:hypothetical protein